MLLVHGFTLLYPMFVVLLYMYFVCETSEARCILLVRIAVKYTRHSFFSIIMYDTVVVLASALRNKDKLLHVAVVAT